MPDELDKTQDRMEFLEQKDIDAVRRKAASIPAGEAGECELCGEYFARIVRGACARCRDRNGLP